MQSAFFTKLLYYYNITLIIEQDFFVQPASGYLSVSDFTSAFACSLLSRLFSIRETRL